MLKVVGAEPAEFTPTTAFNMFNKDFKVLIPDGKGGIAEEVTIQVPMYWDADLETMILGPGAVKQIEQTKAKRMAELGIKLPEVCVICGKNPPVKEHLCVKCNTMKDKQAFYLPPPLINNQITVESFQKLTGRLPEDDDLERVNCNKPGAPGHTACGLCAAHSKPMFMCTECYTKLIS